MDATAWGSRGASSTATAWPSCCSTGSHRYPIVSIEDPFGEDDRDGWIAFTRAAGTRVQIIGDDYLTTNAARVEAAARDRACNAVLIKPNQAGTVTETLAALQAGKAAGFGTIVSARSGRDRGRRRSSTSPWAGTRASSRSARSRGRNGWQNGTRGCASRRRSAPRRGWLRRSPRFALARCGALLAGEC